jgi:hypothetical protein
MLSLGSTTFCSGLTLLLSDMTRYVRGGSGGRSFIRATAAEVSATGSALTCTSSAVLPSSTGFYAFNSTSPYYYFCSWVIPPNNSTVRIISLSFSLSSNSYFYVDEGVMQGTQFSNLHYLGRSSGQSAITYYAMSATTALRISSPPPTPSLTLQVLSRLQLCPRQRLAQPLGLPFRQRHLSIVLVSFLSKPLSSPPRLELPLHNGLPPARAELHVVVSADGRACHSRLVRFQPEFLFRLLVRIGWLVLSAPDLLLRDITNDFSSTGCVCCQSPVQEPSSQSHLSGSQSPRTFSQSPSWQTSPTLSHLPSPIARQRRLPSPRP